MSDGAVVDVDDVLTQSQAPVPQPSQPPNQPIHNHPTTLLACLQFLEVGHVGPHEVRREEVVEAEAAEVEEGGEGAPHLLGRWRLVLKCVALDFFFFFF